jgi:hypothetical protein
MKALCSSERLISYHFSTLHHNLELDLNLHCCGNLMSHIHKVDAEKYMPSKISTFNHTTANIQLIKTVIIQKHSKLVLYRRRKL